MSALADRIERTTLARAEKPGVTKFIFEEDSDS
jgi:hypothetical protein